MNISNIKEAIAKAAGIQLPNLLLNRQKDVTNNDAPTEWLAHWDNESRVRIVLHNDVAAKIKAEPEYNGLAFKKEVVAAHDVAGVGNVAEYTRFVIINPTSVEMIL